MEEKKESKLGLGILIGLLIAAVVGLGTFIVYDKVISNDKKDNEKVVEPTPSATPTNGQKPKKETDTFDLSKFDGNKVINGNSKDFKYELYDNTGDNTRLGISASLNSDNKSVTLKIDFSKYGLYVLNENINEIKEYTVNFNKTIKSIYVGGYGHDAGRENLFAIMSDGTVAHVEFAKTIYTANKTNVTLTPKTIDGVSDIVLISGGQSDAICEGCYGGGIEVFAFKKDGTFYILNSLIK